MNFTDFKGEFTQSYTKKNRIRIGTCDSICESIYFPNREGMDIGKFQGLFFSLFCFSFFKTNFQESVNYCKLSLIRNVRMVLQCNI